MIGPNGAGKSTRVQRDHGRLRADRGRRPPRRRIDRRHASRTRSRRMGIARTFQSLRLFLNMTVKENVKAATYGNTQGIAARVDPAPAARAPRGARGRRAAPRRCSSFFGERLEGYRWDQPAYVLSYANRRRLEIARALATRPRLLLLDEPAAGMNPNETHEITELIARLRDELRLTILVIEHDMHVVEGISDRVIALDHGDQAHRGQLPRGRQPPGRDRGLPGARPRGARRGMSRDGAPARSTTSRPTTARCGSSRGSRSRSSPASSSACSAATRRASRRR